MLLRKGGIVGVPYAVVREKGLETAKGHLVIPVLQPHTF